MKDYVKGLVSVIIPTYKRSDYLVRAIETVLNQTYKNLELIIVNDNEKNDEYSQKVYQIVRDINDPRFIFIEQDKHVNGARARNVGIKVAKGEYIAFQDDDDYWEPQKLEYQVRSLSKLDNSWGAVACLNRLYNHGELVEVTLPYKSGDVLFKILDTEVSLGTGATLIRRVALDQTGYFDETLSRHQDLQVYARLAAKYKVKLDKVYLQNREISDTQNRPSAAKLEKVKKAYFNSISDIMQNLNNEEKKIVYNMQSMEVGYVYIKEGNRKKGFRYMSRVFTSFYSTVFATNKIIKKLESRYFRKIINSKYKL